tara:strand:- start:545 stop:826 length:282 start_codon:yes stop_codon:yes gene_type:complete
MNINFKQLYEDDIEDVTKELMKYPRYFGDLPHEVQRFVEDLVSAGYQRALADALDPTVLEETKELSREMSTQLSSMADLVESFLASSNNAGPN